MWQYSTRLVFIKRSLHKMIFSANNQHCVTGYCKRFEQHVVQLLQCDVKTCSNGSDILAKHYPTLLGGVGRCLICVGLCWMLECANESNTIQQCWISVPGLMILITQAKMLDDVGRKSNFIQHFPTLFNMFDCAVQTDQTCCVLLCFKMVDQHV